MFNNTIHLPMRRLAAIALAGLTLLASAGSASAGDRPTRPEYVTIRGSGDWVADPTGAAAAAPVGVWLPHASDSTPAEATARVQPLDGTFPGAEQCEPATAVLVTSGAGRVTMTLTAQGNVCGGFTEDPTTLPTQQFIGRYVVTGGAPRFRGDDGFLQVQLYADGGAYLFATDS